MAFRLIGPTKIAFTLCPDYSTKSRRRSSAELLAR